MNYVAGSCAEMAKQNRKPGLTGGFRLSNVSFLLAIGARLLPPESAPHCGLFLLRRQAALPDTRAPGVARTGVRQQASAAGLDSGTGTNGVKHTRKRPPHDTGTPEEERVAANKHGSRKVLDVPLEAK